MAVNILSASKIVPSERGDTQVTAEQSVSTQIKEWVYEIRGKRKPVLLLKP